MDGGDNEVREWDILGCGFGDEREEGNEFCGVLVVGLVIDNHAWFVGRWAGWDGGSHGDLACANWRRMLGKRRSLSTPCSR